jgi:hypothetical protein
MATWKVWFTTEMGFELIITVEAKNYDEARHKAQLQAPKGSTYRYALKLEEKAKP